MLRLRPSLILRSAQVIQDSLISRLLPVVGDLSSANNELRWLREDSQKRASESEQQSLLKQHVSRRSRGEPLQYILGSAYFGDLEIKCRPGVFIPRPETAAAVSYLVQSLVSQREKRVESGQRRQARTKTGKNRKQRELHRMQTTIKIFDLCSGSGCIPLLFWHQFYNSASTKNFTVPHLDIIGLDASPEALKLAQENHAALLSQKSQQIVSSPEAMLSLQQMEFIHTNVLRRKTSPEELLGLNTLRQAVGEHANRLAGDAKILKYVKDNDIWISNPPYISPANYFKTTNKSVRDFEPKAALVPPVPSTATERGVMTSRNDGERFHRDILDQAMELRAKVILLEVEDIEQATRVAEFAVTQRHWHTFEIWRDLPSDRVPDTIFPIREKNVRTIGSGEARSVLVCTRDGADLIGRYPPRKNEALRARKEYTITKSREKIQKTAESLEGLKQRKVEEAENEEENRQRAGRSLKIGDKNRHRNSWAKEKTFRTAEAQLVATTGQVSAQAREGNSRDAPHTSSEMLRRHQKAIPNPAHGAEAQDIPRKAHIDRLSPIRHDSEVPETTSLPHQRRILPEVKERLIHVKPDQKMFTFRKHRSSRISGPVIDVSGHGRALGIKTEAPVEDSSNGTETPVSPNKISVEKFDSGSTLRYNSESANLSNARIINPDQKQAQKTSKKSGAPNPSTRPSKLSKRSKVKRRAQRKIRSSHKSTVVESVAQK